MSDWQREPPSKLSSFPTSFVVAYRMGSRTRFYWRIVPALFNKTAARERQNIIASQGWPAIVMPAGTEAPEEWEPEGYEIRCAKR